MEKIIEVHDLKKTYGKIEAVKGIDFYVEAGKMFAFLGPNGAGKSTTINMITTFLKPDQGDVIINGYHLGKNDAAIRNSIGAVFQDSLLDRKLSVEENLRCRGSLYGMRKKELHKAIEETIVMCELQSIRHQRYEQLSGGQRRRCDIARALLHTPKLLFLDEPTTGLDPNTRAMVWKLIQKLQKEKGVSVFLTTHYMEEAAAADYIIVINHGDIVAKGTPEALKEKYAKDTLKLEAIDDTQMMQLLQQHEIPFTNYHEQYLIALDHTIEALAILDIVREYIQSFEVIHGTMDDAFLRIIQEEDDIC